MHYNSLQESAFDTGFIIADGELNDYFKMNKLMYFHGLVKNNQFECQTQNKS